MVVTAVITWLITRASCNSRLEEVRQSAQRRLEDAKDSYDRALKEIKESEARLLESTRNELTLENDKALKAREEALKQQAEESLRGITESLNKDIKDMKEAFEAQKEANIKGSSEIRTKFDETVNNLRLQTEAIGNQAVDLANALKGQNKMQGIFGETILENLLQKEGLTKGRDYDTEVYLRDKNGAILRNDDSGKRMRPDFVVHFPDQTDLLLDSKLSLTALTDYFAADTDEERADAAARNLKSVNDHIAELTGKEYQKYVQGRRTLDYVIMFIPNYGAYQLAKQADPDIFQKAFRQNVLITTDETLMPFLRLIRSAWIQRETIDNMDRIVDGARKMLDRVADFCKTNAEVTDKLEAALESLKKNNRRLVDSRQSIAKAAHEVADCGVALSPGKALPALETTNDENLMEA